MSEYLELKEEEIPEYNPNPKNDIYRVNGTKNADGMLIVGIIVSILIIIFCTHYKDNIVLLIGGGLLGSLWLFMCIAFLYSKHCMRKKIIAKGKSYPAVVIRAFDYINSVGTTYASTQKITEYGIEVKYLKGTREFTGYDGDAGEYLENSYCTVYEWNNRTIVADFKVRDKYITQDGKSYSLKPVKK